MTHPKLDETITAIKRSIVTLDSGLRMSQHPLYHTLWHHQEMSPEQIPENMQEYMGEPWLRRYVDFKLHDLDEAEKTGNWSRYVFTHERPYRVAALRSIIGKGDMDDLILEVWLDTEFPYVSVDDWNYIFRHTSIDKQKRRKIPCPARLPESGHPCHLCQ